MLPEDGPVIAPPETTPAAWAASLPAERSPLVLASASERGWFGGRALIALDPVSVDELASEDALDDAGRVLDTARLATDATLTALLLEYEGGGSVARYESGLILTEEGWRTWGDLDPSSLTSPSEPETLDGGPLVATPRRDFEMRAFAEAVEQVRDAVAAGDVYVLNLTYRLRGTPLLPPGELFATLCARGAADMSAALITEERSVVSVSPERFLSVRRGYASIQPRGRAREA